MTKRTRPRKPDAYDPNLSHFLRRCMEFPVDSNGREFPVGRSGQEGPDDWRGRFALVPLWLLDEILLRLEPKPRLRPKTERQKENDRKLIAWARRRKLELQSEGTPKGDATVQAAEEAAKRSLFSSTYIKDRMQRRS
jgi:hypothetical protein